MDTTEILVVIAGVAAIAGVLWYFFGRREGVAARADERGVQEVKITVMHEIAHHFGIDDDRLHELGWA